MLLRTIYESAHLLSLCLLRQAYGWCPSGSRCPMSHDTDLIIRQDEKSREDKRKKRKRRKKKAAKEEDGGGGGGEEKEDGMPQDKKAHVEHMEHDGEETGERKEDGKAGGENRTGHDGDTAGSETPAAESRSDTDAGQTLHQTPDVTNAEPKACEKKVEGGTHRAGFDAFMTGYVFAFASARNAEGSWIPSCANKLYLSGKSVPLHIAKSAFSKSSKAHVTKMEHIWKISQSGRERVTEFL